MPDDRQPSIPDWRRRVSDRLAGGGLEPDRHADAVDEIAQHLDHLYRAEIRRGASDAEAAAVVEAELVAIEPAGRRPGRSRPSIGDEPSSWAAGLTGDLRVAVRAVGRERGFAALAILTLAVGIGACTTVFSIINSVLWQSLPYPHPEQLVLALETDGRDRSATSIVAQPVYEDWRRETRSFQALGIWEFQTFNLSSSEEPEQVPGVRASASLFDVMSVPPRLGRVFTADEEGPGSRLAVVSDGVWRTQLGGRALSADTTIRLNGEPFQVIGVMPRDFAFPRAATGVWVPAGFTEQDGERGSHSFWVAGRLRPGISLDSARADIEQVGQALAQRYEENRDEGSTVVAMHEQGLSRLRPMLRALMGAVLLVLVIACVNVANLQLARALARRREFVVRLALGAGVARLARQLLAESFVLALAGGSCGLAIAWSATRAADLVLGPGFRMLPFRVEAPIAIDATVLGFALLLSFGCAALFGLAPLAGLQRQEPQALLRDGGRASTALAATARRILVTAEVALATIVLCGAGLLVKSLAGLLSVPPGLNPEQVLTLQVSLPQINPYGPPLRESFCADLGEAAAATPDLLSVGAISHLPLSGANAGRALTIEGRAAATSQDAAQGAYRLACPGYFKTLEIPLLEGREFTDRDVTRGLLVAIVNRTMATQYWPGQSPIGRRLKLGSPNDDTPWLTVVGVAEDVRHFGLEAATRREFYLPYSQSAWPVMTIVARTPGDPRRSQPTLRAVLRRVDPQLPVAQVQSMEDVIGSSVGWRQTPMRLLAGFAVIGLLLASVGVYGVLAYYVSQRSREIGVRAALGASRAQLAGLVVRQSLLPLGLGALLGAGSSILTGRLLQQFLYDVRPADPQVLLGILLLVCGVGVLAGWLPARRAASIDPMVTLRDN